MKIEAQKVEEAYKKNKSVLNAKEKDIITCYYGIAKEVRHTLAELGEKYGVTRERIRQVKSVALSKIGIN